MTFAPDFPLHVDNVAGQPYAQLADQFGTPLYVYDATVIERRITELAPFDVTRYAQKACSNLAILDFMRRRGVVVDTVSAGEIQRSLQAGYLPGVGPHPQIVYTADLFDREALALVTEHQIAVNCGSPDMIDQLGAVTPGCEITLRINPGFGHGHSQKTNTGGAGSKHGIWHTQVEECVRRAARFGITVTGLHMHIGSGTDMDHLSRVCQAMETAARQAGPQIHTISAGGGLPTPYRAEDQRVDVAAYFGLWDATRQRLASEFGHAITLEIEPGRYLVAESGSLLSEIRAVKQMGENLYYVVDAGFNNLARPILYGAYHPMAVCYRGAEPEHSTQKLQPVVVGGPLCESGDIFTQAEGGYISPRELPVAAVGDFLVIGCTGAYGSVMGSNYNSKPHAAEVLIYKGQVHLIRRRQSFDDLVRNEFMPDW